MVAKGKIMTELCHSKLKKTYIRLTRGVCEKQFCFRNQSLESHHQTQSLTKIKQKG